MTNNLSNR